MNARNVYVFCKAIEPSVPLFMSLVSAGFPSPADDYIEQPLDLNAFVTIHPEATFFVRVQGESMNHGEIHDGDILVVDRSLEARSGHVVIAALYGEMVVKRLQYKSGRCFLSPDNPAFESYDITESSDCMIWGVVTHVLHTLL